RLLVREEAASFSRSAERAEEVRSDDRAGDALRLVALAEVEGVRVVGREFLEGVRLVAPVEIVCGRDRAMLPGVVGALLPDHHGAIRRLKGEGAQQQRVDA